MSLVEAQKNPRLRRYPLRRHRLSTAAGTLSIVCPASAASSEALSGAMERAAQRGTEPPYWAQVWPAAVGLGRFLLRTFHAGELAGAEVVDLGCGVGVAGAAAALAGARVTMVDLHDDALEFARFNGEHQKLASPQRVTTRSMDWNRDVVGPTQHLLMADVSYRRVHHAPLRRQLDSALFPASGACAWHADPFRVASTHFLDSLAQDYDVERSEISAHFDDERLRVRLASIRRR